MVHQAILEATESLIVSLPYRAVTIEKIAANAGVGKSTVYRWWPTKDDLILEVVLDRWYEPESPPATGSVRGDLVEYCSRNVQNLIRGAGELILQVALNAIDPRESAAVARIQATLAHRRQVGRSILQRAIAEGLLPAESDIDLLLDVLAGTALFRSLKLGDGSLDMVDSLVDLVLGGERPNVFRQSA